MLDIELDNFIVPDGQRSGRLWTWANDAWGKIKDVLFIKKQLGDELAEELNFAKWAFSRQRLKVVCKLMLTNKECRKGSACEGWVHAKCK